MGSRRSVTPSFHSVQLESISSTIRYGDTRTMFHQNPLIRQALAAFVSSLSIFCAGSTYTWITPLLYRLKQEDSIIPLTSDQASWAVALIEFGNLFTPIPAGFLVDLWGRKWILWFTGPVYICTWVLALFSRSVNLLYLQRTVQGMVMSIQFTVLPMYLAEIAGPNLRGALSTFFQGMWYLGILYEYAFGAAFEYEGLTWSSIVPPAVFAATFFWLPESPYYLLMKGRNEQAVKSLSWLRGKTTKDPDVIEELRIMQTGIQEEKDNKGNWRDIISTREGRKALIIVQIVAMTEIMSGLTTVLLYVSDTFTATCGKPDLANIATVVLGVLLFMVTIVTSFLVDRLGRRPILLISTIGGAVFLIITAIFYAFVTYNIMNLENLLWIPFVGITLFMILISFGVGALVPTLQTEFFPNSTRGIASGITIFHITVLSFICLKMYQIIGDYWGLYVNYLIFFIFTIFGAINVYFFLPETKGKTFAEIQKLI